MSRILFSLILLFGSGLLLPAQENERRRPVRLEAVWPMFQPGQQGQGVRIGLHGLAQMEPDSAARLDLATAILESMLEAGKVDAAGAWLQHEPALNVSCTAWARLAVAAARIKAVGALKRAQAEAERLAAISPQREGRAGLVLLYEGALLADSANAERFLIPISGDDFESQSDLKGVKIRRIGEGLDSKMNEPDLKALLAPPQTQASLNLMAYALGLVKLVRTGVCDSGAVPFAAIANQAVTCALESAANPAPVLVSVLADSRRFDDVVPLDDWFEKATKFLALANLDEDKPSYLLDLARVAQRRGDKAGQEALIEASEVSLAQLEPALQPEGYFRLGQTHVRQGQVDQAWRVWGELLDLLERNSNRDLRFQFIGEIALEIEKWVGDVTSLKAGALAEIETRVGGLN